MRKFIVNVNGASYEVEVEEITGAASAPGACAGIGGPACSCRSSGSSGSKCGFRRQANIRRRADAGQYSGRTGKGGRCGESG